MVQLGSKVEGEKPSTGKSSLSAKQISDALSSLKKVSTWPEEGAEAPLYADESATIYLQFTSNKVLTANKPIGRVTLPHPLSYRRRVCWVARGMQKDKSIKFKLRGLLADIGIKGNMKIVPVEHLQAATAAKDVEALETLATKYDTHLADRKALGMIAVIGLHEAMSAHGKQFNRIDNSSQTALPALLEEALNKSFAIANASKDAYEWKVAHSGLTDAQIVENVQAALGQLANWTTSFPKGLKHFKSVDLKMGDNDGVPIYTNTGVVEDEVEYHRHEYQKAAAPKAGEELYWMNRQQEKDGLPHWRMTDRMNKKLDNLLKTQKALKRKGEEVPKLTPEKIMKLVTARGAASPANKTPGKGTPNNKRLSAGGMQTPGQTQDNSGAPNSSGKKNKNRKSKKNSPFQTPQATQGDGTPGSGGKKTPKSGPKTRLRQRASMGFPKKEKLDL